MCDVKTIPLKCFVLVIKMLHLNQRYAKDLAVDGGLVKVLQLEQGASQIDSNSVFSSFCFILHFQEKKSTFGLTRFLFPQCRRSMITINILFLENPVNM